MYKFVAEIKNRAAGYICGQPGNKLISVGPWASADPAVNPIQLLKCLSLQTGESDLRVGILERNKNAADLMRSLKSFEEGIHSWRMAMGKSDTLGINDNLLAIGSGAKG